LPPFTHSNRGKFEYGERMLFLEALEKRKRVIYLIKRELPFYGIE
jgi:hypothetical protein